MSNINVVIADDNEDSSEFTGNCFKGECDMTLVGSA